jgi:hypothetical protein
MALMINDLTWPSEADALIGQIDAAKRSADALTKALRELEPMVRAWLQANDLEHHFTQDKTILDDDEMDRDGLEIDPGPGGLVEAIAKNIAGVCYGLDDLAASVRTAVSVKNLREH